MLSEFQFSEEGQFGRKIDKKFRSKKYDTKREDHVLRSQ
jgi:hypothetical protein